MSLYKHLVGIYKYTVNLYEKEKRVEPLSLSMHLSARDNSFAWRFKRDWCNTVSRFAAEMGLDCYGAKVLEIGAGVHNPLGCSLISLAKGAAVAAAVEPGSILPEHLDHAILLGLIAQHYAKARDPTLSTTLDALMGRVNKEPCQPNPGWVFKAPSVELFCGTIQDYKSDHQFDIVHSNAVIEHVLDLENACARLYDLTAPGGIHIHKVDFIDHRYYEVSKRDTEDAFRFLLVGQEYSSPECNGLRKSEVIDVFTHSGFEFIDAPEVWQVPFPKKLFPQLQMRYRDLPLTDIQTTCATLVFRKSVVFD